MDLSVFILGLSESSILRTGKKDERISFLSNEVVDRKLMDFLDLQEL